MKGITAFKGATAYELQIGPFCVQFCHLMGGDWEWYTFFGRFNFMFEDKKIKAARTNEEAILAIGDIIARNNRRL